jgi:hypothetical protein
LLMLAADWERNPLVLIGSNDYTMWPLLPPGSLLELHPQKRAIRNGIWTEFERPIYLIEYQDRLNCCYAQRRGNTLLLVAHPESPAPPSRSVPFSEAIVRGQITPIFKPLATPGSETDRKSKTP